MDRRNFIGTTGKAGAAVLALNSLSQLLMAQTESTKPTLTYYWHNVVGDKAGKYEYVIGIDWSVYNCCSDIQEIMESYEALPTSKKNIRFISYKYGTNPADGKLTSDRAEYLCTVKSFEIEKKKIGDNTYESTLYNFECAIDMIMKGEENLAADFPKSFYLVYTNSIFNLYTDESKKESLYKFSDKSSNTSPLGCFLTTACTAARGLPDNCYELQLLRKFRDTYIKENAAELVDQYYEIAPQIVSRLANQPNAGQIYDHMYQTLVLPSIGLIEAGDNKGALNHYKTYTEGLEALVL